MCSHVTRRQEARRAYGAFSAIPYFLPRTAWFYPKILVLDVRRRRWRDGPASAATLGAKHALAAASLLPSSSRSSQYGDGSGSAAAEHTRNNQKKRGV